jgi:hypothetical protein
MLTWGGSLAVGGLLLLVLAGLAQVQAADLCIPPVCSFSFVLVRIPATGAGPLNGGALFPGITFPNGAQSGSLYIDQGQHKQELIIFGPDGVTPALAVWEDFSAHVQFNYNYKTNVCTESDFNLTETPFCLAYNATELGTYPPHWDFYVAAPTPGNSVEAGMQQNSLSKPGFVRWRDGANTGEMRFYNFSTSPIPPTQFAVPANCTE